MDLRLGIQKAHLESFSNLKPLKRDNSEKIFLSTNLYKSEKSIFEDTTPLFNTSSKKKIKSLIKSKKDLENKVF